MKTRFTAVAIGLTVGISGMFWQTDAQSATLNDYRAYLLGSGYIVSGSQQCASICAQDRSCRSYTVAPAGTYADQPTCWRLSVVPNEPILIQTGIRQVRKTDVLTSSHEPVLTHSQPSGTGYHAAPDTAVDYYENSVATTYTDGRGHKQESIVPATHNEGQAIAAVSGAKERLLEGSGHNHSGEVVVPGTVTTLLAYSGATPPGPVSQQAPRIAQPQFQQPYGYGQQQSVYGYAQPQYQQPYGYAQQQPAYGYAQQQPQPQNLVQPQQYGYGQPQAVVQPQQYGYGYAQPQQQVQYQQPSYATPTQLPQTTALNTTAGASLEPGYDRPGFDLRPAFATVSVQQCVSACYGNNQCRSFSFNDRAIPGPSGMCSIKAQVAPVRRDDCCTSGTRASALLR